MDTIKNYCHYFKDLSFEESLFNDVDNILLSTIVYLDFKDIVKETKQRIIFTFKLSITYSSWESDENDTYVDDDTSNIKSKDI